MARLAYAGNRIVSKPAAFICSVFGVVRAPAKIPTSRAKYAREMGHPSFSVSWWLPDSGFLRSRFASRRNDNSTFLQDDPLRHPLDRQQRQIVQRRGVGEGAKVVEASGDDVAGAARCFLTYEVENAVDAVFAFAAASLE